MDDHLRVLLVCTGDDTYHDHAKIGSFLHEMLTASGFKTTYVNNLDTLTSENVSRFDTIVMYAVQTQTAGDKVEVLLDAIRGVQPNDRGRPVGFVGLHGVTTSFQNNNEFTHMIGASFITHPDAGPVYRFSVKDPVHPIMQGVVDFDLADELYFFDIHTRINVLLSCPHEEVERPVAWNKMYGRGRVFYLALGHDTDQLGNQNVRRMIENGMRWTAGE